MLQLEAQPLHVPIQDPRREVEQTRVRIQDPRREVEQPRVQIQDLRREVEQPRREVEQIQDRLQEAILRALIQVRDQIDLLHVRAHPLLPGQDQVHQHEVVEAAAAVAEEEIIRRIQTGT